MAAKKRKVRTRNDRLRVTSNTVGPSLTEQNHARACDINSIMARYVKTGLIDHVQSYQPTYGDVSEKDFQNAMQLVAGVISEFEQLPAFVRDFYSGDPENYLEAISTPEGIEELRSLTPKGMAYDRDGVPAPRSGPKGTPPEGENENVPQEPSEAQSAQNSE